MSLGFVIQALQSVNGVLDYTLQTKNEMNKQRICSFVDYQQCSQMKAKLLVMSS